MWGSISLTEVYLLNRLPSGAGSYHMVMIIIEEWVAAIIVGIKSFKRKFNLCLIYQSINIRSFRDTTWACVHLHFCLFVCVGDVRVG